MPPRSIVALTTSFVAAIGGPALAQTPPARAVASEAAPRVHVRTNAQGLVLYEAAREIPVLWKDGAEHADRRASLPMCVAPCDQIIDARHGRSFFVAGPGFRPSSRFRFDQGWSDVVIDVNPGSSGQYTGGAMMAALGGAALGLGALFVGMGTRGTLALDSTTGAYEYVPNRAFQIAGGVGLGVGLGVLVGGVVLMMKNRTTISLSQARASSAMLSF